MENIYDFANVINRRQFITLSGFTIMGLSLLSFTGWDNTVAAAGRSKVGLIRTSERAEGVKRSLKLIQLPDVSGDSVLIKPNFNTADPTPGSTHNDTLITIVEELKNAGAERIIIGERSGPPDTEDVMEEKGIFEIAEEYDLEIINFDQLSDDELVHFNQEGLHWPDGFQIPKILNEVDHIIATGCLKTHQYGGQFTMALKLAVGIIPREGTNYMNQLHNSDDMRKMIAEISLAYQPDLYLIDGVEAFTTGGPSAGNKVNSNIFLVSKDPVAIDAVGVAMLKNLGSTEIIMNTPVFELEQIARAAEIELGVSKPEEIEIISDSEAGDSLAGELKSLLV
ncbi:MAG: DUF362 domain-containing protein [Halanaerobiaceae bacterium]